MKWHRSNTSPTFEDEEAQACPCHAPSGLPSHWKVAEAAFDPRSPRYKAPTFLQYSLKRHRSLLTTQKGPICIRVCWQSDGCLQEYEKEFKMTYSSWMHLSTACSNAKAKSYGKLHIQKSKGCFATLQRQSALLQASEQPRCSHRPFLTKLPNV